MKEEQKEQLRQKWKRWLDEIGNQLGWLLTSHDIFEELRHIVDSNKKIQSPDLFYRWILDNYVARVTVGIVRLNDCDTRTISLRRLITEISENPDAMTRDYYVSGYTNKAPVDIGAADRGFDNFAEKGDKHISPDKLNEDIALLDEKTRVIKIFRDKWVAHFDQNRQDKLLPTFEDVKDALAAIDRTFCKYYLLLTRGSPATRKGTLTVNWKEQLKHPWIEMTEEEKRWREEKSKKKAR